MTVSEAKDLLQNTLQSLYDSREAAQICNMVLEHLTGMNRTERAIAKQQLLNDTQKAQLIAFANDLSEGKPVQYVLGEAWFAGLRFSVNEHTLIPRPETEELIEWIKAVANPEPQRVIDIGTGSGCIPIVLKKEFPLWQVEAIDLSAEALIIANQNATTLGADIDFKQVDFLHEANWSAFSKYDVIVSNPPYIKQSEQSSMAQHVVDHEPHLALFVPDDDALIFYKKIAAFGKQHLSKKGKIFLEINQVLGKEVCQLFESSGYQTRLRKDLHENDRMVMVTF
ncbi:MAG: peptide chain release factor N(5)-glutamine methyltransferase [Sediminibacterium sp.]